MGSRTGIAAAVAAWTLAAGAAAHADVNAPASAPPKRAAAPPSSALFESTIRAVRPPIAGLRLEVVHDETLRLKNDTKRTVVVRGYDGEQYLRFRPDGTVERNQRAPATYFNAGRVASAVPPPSAKRGALPRWRVISTNGIFQWYDHRIHLDGIPPELRRRKTRIKVFDWKVPLRVGGRSVAAVGTLVWDPDAANRRSSARAGGGGLAAGWIATIAAVTVLALVTLAVALRRMRPRAGEHTV